MTIAATVPLIVSILIATVGWLFTYLHKRHLEIRAARLERVNDQLRLLYGPLYAVLCAGDAAWEAFSENYWPAHGQESFFPEDEEPTEEETALWRLWMTHVFHPLNEKIEGIIVEHMDLLDDAEVPQAYFDALAHIAAYHAVLRQWEDQDYREHTSIINFPTVDLRNAVEPAFLRLREEQESLIRDVQMPWHPFGLRTGR